MKADQTKDQTRHIA